MIARIVGLCLLLAVSVAADSGDVLKGTRLVLQFPSGSSQAQQAATMAIIRGRLDDVSSYRIEASGPNRVSLTIGSDANEVGLKMRLTRPGVLTFQTLDGSQSLTLQHDDLLRVRGGIDEDPPALLLQLSAEAARRLAAMATEPRMTVRLDGVDIGPIRRPRQRRDGFWPVAGPRLDDATVAALSLVVSNGPLPLQPRLIKIVPP